MTTEEALNKLQTDPDFIYLKRFDYSLAKLLKRYPEGVPNNKLIAQALMITEEDVDRLYADIVESLKSKLL